MTDTRDIRRGAKLNARNLREWIESARTTVTGGRGNLSNQRDSRVILSRAGHSQRTRPRFPAKIGTATSLGNNKWTYPFDEVIKGSAGYAGWSVKTNGRSDADDWGEAFNMAEAANAATGIQGNGVSVANLLGTFAHQPIPPNSIVMVEIFQLDDQSAYEAWIDRVISVDGAC